MRAWEIVSDGGVDALALNERAKTEPGPGEVLVKVKASAINYRDLSTIEDPVSRGLKYPMMPNSDAAGEIASLGAGVQGFKAGDRVASCFFADWPAGPVTPAAMASALGGARPGVLAEYVTLPAGGVVRVPEHLSDREAATLPCAALTAWHALSAPEPVRPGERVLLLGTGGVSVFAQQFCNILGAETIATSSSDDKLARMKALGAGATINYKTTTDWEKAVLELTGGAGVDRVVEVGGPGTLQKSIAATRVGGTVALIGILTGAAGQVTPTDIMRKSITLRGVYVGSRRMFEDMNRAVAQHALKPVIDRAFVFEDARDAYRAMRQAGHFGKLVIDVA
ncbi:MAG: NAD(P)-dependent alcohol dehydrogenase [Rhodospirillaceae bacterium]